MFVEEFLGLVDLGGQVRATAAIGVVEQHKLTVLLAHLVLVQFALTVGEYRVSLSQGALRGSIQKTYGSSRIREASRRVMRGSNPLSCC